MRRMVRLGALMLFAGLFACASAAGPGQCKISLQFQASKIANANKAGTPFPTTVRIYQLKEVQHLRKAAFDEIWSRDRAILGDDLIEVQEFVIYPDQKHAEVVLVNDEAEYLAGVAVFRNPEGQKWYAYKRLPPFASVARCAEDKPGGPYYFRIKGSQLDGSVKPFAAD